MEILPRGRHQDDRAEWPAAEPLEDALPTVSEFLFLCARCQFDTSISSNQIPNFTTHPEARWPLAAQHPQVDRLFSPSSQAETSAPSGDNKKTNNFIVSGCWQIGGSQANAAIRLTRRGRSQAIVLLGGNSPLARQ